MTVNPNVNAEVRKWLADHHGVISWYEALKLGASEQFIRHKRATGEWASMYHGVYRDTAVPRTPYQDLRAASLATKGKGVISHASAAWLWHFVDEAPDSVELSIPHRSSKGRKIEGLTVHRSKDLGVDWARSHHHGIVVTNPLRTIVDLASVVPTDVLTNAVDTALAKRLVTLAGLNAELERRSEHGRRGVGMLRLSLLDRGFNGAPAPSVLEAKTLRLIVASDLTLPRVEHQTGPEGEYRLDFAWDEIHFAVEVDGYVWHFSPEHQQRDLQRRNRLDEEGWKLRVYTWRDIRDEGARVTQEIVTGYNKLTNP